MHLFILMITYAITAVTTLNVTSPAFRHEDFIPVKYTCEGENINPPIAIKDLPKGTKSLALIMDDPDASNDTFDHWLTWNIPPSDLISEDNAPGTDGKNSAGHNGYKGPCPSSGIHRYFIKVYALDTKLDLKTGAGKTMLEEAMKGHVLAYGELIGLYKKLK